MGELRGLWRKCKNQAPLARANGIEGYGPTLDKYEKHVRALHKEFPALLIQVNAKGWESCSSKVQSVAKLCGQVNDGYASVKRQSGQLMRALKASLFKVGHHQAKGPRSHQIAFLYSVSGQIEIICGRPSIQATEIRRWLERFPGGTAGAPPDVTREHQAFHASIAKLKQHVSTLRKDPNADVRV